MDKIIWAIDELWLTSGLISGEEFVEAVQEYILGQIEDPEGTSFFQRAAQTINTKKKIPTGFQPLNIPNKRVSQENIQVYIPPSTVVNVIKLYNQGYLNKDIRQETGLLPVQIKAILKDYSGGKISSEFIEKVRRTIQKMQEDVNILINKDTIAKMMNSSPSLVERACKEAGINIQKLIADRRKAIDKMVVDFVKENGHETFPTTKNVLDRFREKTKHSIKISYNDVITALSLNNLAIKPHNVNTLFSAFREFLHNQTNAIQTMQSIISSDRLPRLIDRFIQENGSAYGFPDPPDQAFLKKLLMTKIQMRDRTSQLWGMDKEEGKYYRNYVDPRFVPKIREMLNQGLRSDEIASQLNLDVNKVKMVEQIYNIKNAPFDYSEQHPSSFLPRRQDIDYPEREAKNMKLWYKQSSWYKKSKKWEDQLEGGKADDKTPDDFPKKDVERGRKIEREHSNDPDTAREISLDHLQEHSDYYSGLEHMENLLTELENKKKNNKK